MNRIKILLKLALIAIIATIFLLIFKFNYVQAKDSATGYVKINSSGILYSSDTQSGEATSSKIASQIKSKRNALLDANFKSLMGAHVSHNSNWENYYTAGCFAHYQSNSNTNNRKFLVRQAIYFGMDSSGNYVALNYYLTDSNTQAGPVTVSQSTVYSGNLGKLAGAIIYQINTAKNTFASNSDAQSLTKLYYYFWASLNEGSYTANSLLKTIYNNSWTEGSSSTSSTAAKEATAYASTIKKYSAVKTTCSNTQTNYTSGSYTVYGPITVTYGGGSISKIVATQGSSTIDSNVKWSTSKSSSSPSSSYTSLSSGKVVYLYVLTTSVDDSSKVKFTFTQDTGLYECAILLVASSTYHNQTEGYFTCGSSTIEKTASVTFEITDIDIYIEIIKKDSLTYELIDDIGFTIYDNTRGVYIISSSGATSTTAETLYTVDGEINIALLGLTKKTYSFTVREVSSNNEYYFYTSQNLTKSASSDCTLTYTFYNSPITLEILKSDPNGYTPSTDNSEDESALIFNSMFTAYEGEEVSYEDLVSLLYTVIYNQSSDHEVKVNGEKITDISGIPFETATYVVSCSEGSDGYINAITYTPNFNSIFESYLGSGFTYEDVQSIVDLIEDANEFYSGEHYVTVNNINDTENLDIENYKNWDGLFEITAEYDSDGYICNITYTYYETKTVTGETINEALLNDSYSVVEEYGLSR